MNTGTEIASHTHSSPSMLSARETAQRALLSAASRVIRYHAAVLDAKVSRMTREQTAEQSHERAAGAGRR